MNISDKGLALICEFEGYHRRLPNGDCIAYQCPAGVWTIGWGCTEGVRPGMVWTRSQADAAFRLELSRFEAAVSRLVTVEINQNEFDALVSFAYNCGEGALARSSILAQLNKGNREGAARGFALWNRGGGRVLPGLVRRRAAEASLFRQLVIPAADPDMPQQVDLPPAKPEGSRIAATGTAGEAATVGLGIGGLGLGLGDALGFTGQILPQLKAYGFPLFIGTMFVLAAGFALVKAYRRQDHETGKTLL